MSSLVTGGRTKPALLAAGLCAGLAGVFGSDIGRASDGDLQRALLVSGCVQATIRTLPPLGLTLLYEANCFGSSHKLLKIACASGRCVVDNPRAPRDEADGD